MASNELIIDDEYCRSMGQFFEDQGKQLDQLIASYNSILKELRQNAIVSGDVANSLSLYIDYANRLNQLFSKVSDVAKQQINAFIDQVDEADQYLF